MCPKSRIGLIGMALLLALGTASADALEYPTRPITLVVSHKPGGPNDVLARVLTRLLAGVFKQPLVVENRPGAAGLNAAEQVASANPDGHTLLLSTIGMLATPAARAKDLGFDPRADFAPITLIGTQAHALVVNPALPVRTLTHLIELAQAKPRLVTFASAGHGSASHLAGEMFRSEARVSVVHVPYKKPGPALQDVIGGHVQMMFAPAALVENHVRAGRLRPIGIAAPKENPRLPGVATLDELGLPGFDATTSYGLVAPAGTPKEVVDVLHHSIGAVLEDPEARRIMEGLGIDVVGNSPREFKAYIDAQVPKWSTVIRSIIAQMH